MVQYTQKWSDDASEAKSQLCAYALKTTHTHTHTEI